MASKTPPRKKHLHKVRVYYEDTDSGGVVYYANYLKFFERARTEMINSFGISNKRLLEKYGAFIIVKSCNIEYIKPAKLENELKIISIILSVSKTSFTMKQSIELNKDIITNAEIKLVFVNKLGRPILIPESFRNKLD